jgi:hypothetical protein
MSLVYKTLVPFVILLLVNCSSSEKKGQKSGDSEKIKPTEQVLYATFQNEDGTWGYDILSAGKVLIHQPNIPALPGNKGFQLETQATQLAQLVVRKINAGIMPPSVSTEEVKGIIGNPN